MKHGEPITFAGRTYDTRLVTLSNTEEVTVALLQLADALLNDDGEPLNEEAERLDESVFFYATPREWGMDDDNLVILIERVMMENIRRFGSFEERVFSVEG